MTRYNPTLISRFYKLKPICVQTYRRLVIEYRLTSQNKVCQIILECKSYITARIIINVPKFKSRSSEKQTETLLRETILSLSKGLENGI